MNYLGMPLDSAGWTNARLPGTPGDSRWRCRYQCRPLPGQLAAKTTGQRIGKLLTISCPSPRGARRDSGVSGAKSPVKDCKLEFVSHVAAAVAVAAVAVAAVAGSGGAGAVTAMLFFHGAHTVLLKGPPA